MRRAGVVLAVMAMCGVAAAQKTVTLQVAADGSAKYKTLQAAVDALPDAGGTIVLAPGVYREKVNIAKPNVHVQGAGKHPGDVLLVFDANAGAWGGTGKTATLTATGDGFELRNMTVENDYSKRNPAADPNHHEGAQAVALMLRGDRDVVEHARLLGAQDTLYAGGGGHCAAQQPSWTPAPVAAKVPAMANGGACRAVRQFFRDDYIAGHVDFIFGDAVAAFQDCELHGIRNEHVYLTAQSKDTPDRLSAYVFDHCKVTADEGVGELYLGRPWRPYGTVIFLNTAMNAKVQPEGWLDWAQKPGSIATATYGEYNSTGVGAVGEREKYAKRLTAAEAAQYVPAKLMAGADGWRPEGIYTDLK